jgi:hypothetical protein
MTEHVGHSKLHSRPLTTKTCPFRNHVQQPLLDMIRDLPSVYKIGMIMQSGDNG